MIPENKLKAYKALIDNGTINVKQVTLNKANGHVTVEYESELGREECRERLRSESREQSN
jgi:hypothetical protein